MDIRVRMDPCLLITRSQKDLDGSLGNFLIASYVAGAAFLFRSQLQGELTQPRPITDSHLGHRVTILSANYEIISHCKHNPKRTISSSLVPSSEEKQVGWGNGGCSGRKACREVPMKPEQRASLCSASKLQVSFFLSLAVPPCAKQKGELTQWLG